MAGASLHGIARHTARMACMQPDLADVLGTRETATLEFKSNARDHDKIGKAICALANDLPNKGGGDLLVGVNDDGTPTGNVDVSESALRNLTNTGTAVALSIGLRSSLNPLSIAASRLSGFMLTRQPPRPSDLMGWRTSGPVRRPSARTRTMNGCLPSADAPTTCLTRCGRDTSPR